MAAADNGREKDQLCEVILNAANDLFNEFGAEAVSMHQIAKSAGVGQGTLYRRYSSKAELCMDIMKESFYEFKQGVDNYLAETEPLPVQTRLRGMIGLIVDFLHKESRWLGIIQSHNHKEHLKGDFYHSPPYHYLHGILSGLLERADHHELVKPIDANFIAHSYIAVLSPHTYHHFVHMNEYTKDEVYERFCRSFIDPLFQEDIE